MSVHHAKVAYKSNVQVLNKYLLLAKKEQELVRAQKLGLSYLYQEKLEEVITALQQTLSR